MQERKKSQPHALAQELRALTLYEADGLSANSVISDNISEFSDGDGYRPGTSYNQQVGARQDPDDDFIDFTGFTADEILLANCTIRLTNAAQALSYASLDPEAKRPCPICGEGQMLYDASGNVCFEGTPHPKERCRWSERSYNHETGKTHIFLSLSKLSRQREDYVQTSVARLERPNLLFPGITDKDELKKKYQKFLDDLMVMKHKADQEWKAQSDSGRNRDNGRGHPPGGGRGYPGGNRGYAGGGRASGQDRGYNKYKPPSANNQPPPQIATSGLGWQMGAPLDADYNLPSAFSDGNISFAGYPTTPSAASSASANDSSNASVISNSAASVETIDSTAPKRRNKRKVDNRPSFMVTGKAPTPGNK